MKVDYILVGQGLAGTLLAFELIRQKKTILVFDNPNQPKASDVAAGLINPIVFRRMKKSWMVDEAFPALQSTYLQLENLLDEKFFFLEEIIRILTKEESADWKEKVSSNKLQEYVNPEPDYSFYNQNVDCPFGVGRITKAARLDIPRLLHSFSDYLDKHQALRKEKFDFRKLQPNQTSVIYNDISADKIIFCEGAIASQNPLFKELNFKHSKGEILELKIPELKLDEILSRNIFIMPYEENCFKVGATYSWDNFDWQTTPEAKGELLTKLNQILKSIPEVLDQKSGIRPTMQDRKPVAGFLPDFPVVGIFNGLGPKGALLGPFFAHQFAELIIGKSDYLHPEIKIERYFRRK